MNPSKVRVTNLRVKTAEHSRLLNKKRPEAEFPPEKDKNWIEVPRKQSKTISFLGSDKTEGSTGTRLAQPKTGKPIKLDIKGNITVPRRSACTKRIKSQTPLITGQIIPFKGSHPGVRPLMHTKRKKQRHIKNKKNGQITSKQDRT